MDTRAADQARARKSLGDLYHEARWPTAGAADAVRRERQELVADLLTLGVQKTASGSKLFSGTLSPSCQACVDGTWSCLYITDWCQADCFYCPQSVESRLGHVAHTPNADGMAFADPIAYADYVADCGFEAVGISGGEPLGALDLVTAYVTAVKERTQGEVYVHAYTNGLMATRERLASLRDAGLDELRFDITARDYDLSALRLARDILPTVTVEMPAIPEDEGRLGAVLRELAGLGIDHLNLHQMQVTADNARAFIDRGHTFLHQPSIADMESETTALRVFRTAASEHIKLSINYCCPAYRTRFQRRAKLGRAASLVRRAPEEITPTGLLRRLSLHDHPDRLAALAERLRAHGRADDRLRFDEDGTLLLDLETLQAAEPGGALLTVAYDQVELSSEAHDEDGDWQEVPGLPSAHLWTRRRSAAEARFTTSAVRDALAELLADRWDEKRAFARIQADAGTTVDDLKAVLGDWSRARQLRPHEVVEEGLGEIG